MIAKLLAVRTSNRRRASTGVRAAAQAGFTLLEVLVVLVILGLLAAVVAGPQIFKYLGTAKSEAAKVQVQQISSALDLYRLEIGRYPSQQEGLEALVVAPAGVTKWNGPYLKKKESILDPWGREFLYRIPGEHGDYDLYTLGADNAQGGNGEDQDITNW
jgi:general secretion pathway protein G